MCFISAILWVSTPLVMNRKADSRLAVVGTADDLAWRDVASKNGATFIEANSDLAKNLLVAADASPTITKGKPTLIVDLGNAGGLTFESDPERIERLLQEKSRKAAVFLLPVLGLLSAVIVSFVLHGSVSVYWLLAGLLGYGSACIWKLSVLCKLCGESSSLDALFVSTGLLLSVGFAGFVFHPRWGQQARNGVAILMCGTAAFQAINWALRPDTICPACTSIAMLTGSIAASLALFGPAPELPEPAKSLAGPSAVIVSLALLLVVNLSSQTSASSAHEIKLNLSSPSLAQSKRHRNADAGKIIVYTSATCHACTELKAWLRQKESGSVTFVDVATVANRELLPDRVPTTRAIAKTGVVLGEVSGWSDDELWQKAYLQFLSKYKADLRKQTQ